MLPFHLGLQLGSIFIFCLSITQFSSCSSEQEKTPERLPPQKITPNPFQQGNSKLKNGEFLDAIEFYSRDLDINPNNPASLNNRGIAKSKSGDEAGAISDYTQAIERQENYAIAYNNRGFAKIKLSDYPGAIRDFSTALRLKPNYANAWNNRAVAYWAIKDRQNACEDWNKAEAIGHREAAKSYLKFCN
ncbi:tetratricopeptide repeat protein [Leptospira sanjuanensis]|uniref:tetratricopeptide repeat protein n=1 Tax=Leptospira sanjuanensis TaxID=2879643 RepID=UPI001EE9180F|nr:tetratricopeptide repeat protein [Leptospira sanjuanensis]MCG6170054.1 tetratricopeptide repeat protein [Leptospira sanjuanensis]